MTYLLKYDGYTFPTTMRPASGEAPLDLAEQERPRGDGSITQTGRQKARVLTIKGEITADTADDLNAIYEAMRAACAPGRLAQLFHGRDDRYVMAQVEGWSDDYQDGLLYGVVTSIVITLRAPAPAWLDITAAAPALDPSGGIITNTGSPAQPLWTIIVDAGGVGSVTLANTDTGETATLAGTFVDGDVITLDRAAYQVQRNGVAEFGLLGGRIPTLRTGDNEIALTSHVATVASAACAYTPRRY